MSDFDPDAIQFETRRRKPLLRLTPTIDAGHVLQALVVGVPVIVYAVATHDAANQTSKELGEFRQDMVGQVSELRKSVNEQNTAMPVAVQRIISLERDVGGMVNHEAAIDQHLGRLDERTAVLQSNVLDLQAASGVKPRK